MSKVQISEETREAVAKDDVPLGAQIEIMQAEMEDMKPGSKAHVKAVVKMHRLRQKMERKRLERRMREMDEDGDMGGMW